MQTPVSETNPKAVLALLFLAGRGDFWFLEPAEEGIDIGEGIVSYRINNDQTVDEVVTAINEIVPKECHIGAADVIEAAKKLEAKSARTR